MDDAARSLRRRQFIFGVIVSTVIAGFFAVFLCLWRVVPDWLVGQWSLRTQYALTPASSLDGLLRRYHQALDNGYSKALHGFLIPRLSDPSVSLEEQAAIVRFYCLRVPRSRARPELFTLGQSWIGNVLDATEDADAEVRRGAVFFMEGLYLGRELYKPVLFAEPDGPSAGMSREDAAQLAYVAYHAWWSLPPERRAERSPLEESGIAIGEP